MRKFTLMTVPVFVLLQALPVFADMRHFRDVMVQEIHLEEGRAKELNSLSARDTRLANSIMESVRQRETSAKKLADRADEMRQKAGYARPWERKALEEFAKDLQAFSQNDYNQASEERRAAEMLDRQAQVGAQSARDHIEYAKRLRERLDYMDHHPY